MLLILYSPIVYRILDIVLVQIREHNYKLNQMLNRVNVIRIPMRNADRLFNELRKTIYYVINKLGIMFDWVGSCYSFNSQSTVREDCFSMSEVAK